MDLLFIIIRTKSTYTLSLLHTSHGVIWLWDSSWTCKKQNLSVPLTDCSADGSEDVVSCQYPRAGCFCHALRAHRLRMFNVWEGKQWIKCVHTLILTYVTMDKCLPVSLANETLTAALRGMLGISACWYNLCQRFRRKNAPQLLKNASQGDNTAVCLQCEQLCGAHCSLEAASLFSSSVGSRWWWT